MDILIKSPKITRGKGIRSVKDEPLVKKFASDRDAAHNKLFENYLSEKKGDKSNYKIIRKLINYDYFYDLLLNKRELQYMNMELLSRVLLFSDNKLGQKKLFGSDPKSEILNYLNNSRFQQNKNDKNDKILLQNKLVIDFFRYVGFVQTLINKNIEIEENPQIEISAYSINRRVEMINPSIDEY